VLLAIFWRLWSNRQRRLPLRLGAAAASVISLLVIFGWFRSGPLKPGWAARAGTPRSLLASGRTALTAATVPRSRPVSEQLPPLPFNASLSGNLRESSQDSNGLVTVRITLRWHGSGRGWLQIALQGQPLDGGGVAMSQSAVTFGPLAQPGEYSGAISALDGSRMLISLSNGSGSSVELLVDLQIGPNGTVSGLLRARTPGEGGLGG
jgi:hypothetical protein